MRTTTCMRNLSPTPPRQPPPLPPKCALPRHARAAGVSRHASSARPPHPSASSRHSTARSRTRTRSHPLCPTQDEQAEAKLGDPKSESKKRHAKS